MIASERQPRLQRVQRWLAKGNHAEGARLQELLGWDTRWPWAAYGGLVQDATAAGIPLFGGNLSRAEVNALLASTGGAVSGAHRPATPVGGGAGPARRRSTDAGRDAGRATGPRHPHGTGADRCACTRRCWWPGAGMYCAVPACRATCHRVRRRW
jgi:hypothetical protein